MKLVERLRGRFGVEFVLRVLGVASSTYRGWVARQATPSDREREDRAITDEITDIHAVSGGTYGSPRVHQVLRRRGVRVSRRRVERLMRQAGLRGAFLRKHCRPHPGNNRLGLSGEAQVERRFLTGRRACKPLRATKKCAASYTISGSCAVRRA